MEAKLKRAAARIAAVPETDIIRIISHYDADGIASAGILCAALLRAGKRFHLSNIKNLDAAFIDTLKEEQTDLVIFSDMGCGQIDLIETLGDNTIILDHHLTVRDTDEIIQINPHFAKIDGTHDACASTVAFLLASAMDGQNGDLVAVALAGIIGDKQHLPALSGLNRDIVEKGCRDGHVRREQGLAFTRRTPKDMLMETEPYIEGISGRPDAIAKFLNKTGIDADYVVTDLGDDQAHAFVSALTARLLRQGARTETVENLIVEKYRLSAFDDMDAGDVSALVDACGRMGQTSTGIAICLGDRDALLRARGLADELKQKILTSLIRLETEKAKQKRAIQYFHETGSSIAGHVAGTAMPYFMNQEKPTVALSKDDDFIKVSLRGTTYLTGKGLNLAVAAQESAEAAGGQGGGHPIAAGAKIPAENEAVFLKKLDECVLSQLSGG